MSIPPVLRVTGIAGSLRTGSLNRALLRAACELAPPGLSIEIFDLGPVPLYNGDLEAGALPEPVRALRAAIADSDALLLATPEYNYGVPGVLKNALDWASRPTGKSCLNGKPAAIMGATPGTGGTSRAQLQLRQSFVFTETHALLKPQLALARAHEKFDAFGRLVDEKTRVLLRELLAALPPWAARFKAP